MILGESLVPAEAERAVRQYHCTSFRSRLLGISSEGYLEVTNKRVVFQASGGNSLIHSEVPIEDVSGINLFRGNYFSWKHFLGCAAIAFFLSGFVTTVLNGILSLFDTEMASLNLVVAVLAVGGSFLLPWRSIWRPVLAGVSTFSLLSTVGMSALGTVGGLGDPYGFGSPYSSGPGIGGGLAMILGPFVSLYALYCAYKYAVRPTMSLSIGSKGGSSTPISIAGASPFGAAFSSAARALGAEPAGDAEAVASELGALIMDIQQRGDFAADRWHGESTT